MSFFLLNNILEVGEVFYYDYFELKKYTEERMNSWDRPRCNAVM